ncbi:Thioesterase/thiol ester dehydrase-isomerase, partial [Violaceomyces palustris]
QTSQAANPQQETNNVREINRLMSQVVKDHHPDIHKVKMPTRLAPKRSWAEEAKSRIVGGEEESKKPLEITPEMESELLRPKRMHDSYVELSLPFSKDPELLERYIATSGLIRLGKILEDLDTLAGAISYQHALGSLPRAGDATAPIFVVTASVDRLDLLEPIKANADYRLSGQVIYVGSSSMEVFVCIEQLGEGGEQNKTCLTGRFTMAARNAAKGKSQRIAPLSLETEAEKALFAMGEAHKNRKRAEAATSLERVPPTKEEAIELHKQFVQSLNKDGVSSSTDRVVHPAKTQLATTMHMHPQQRNVHQKVFGGFLMRSAYELAWMVAASFVQRPVIFLSLDALSFHAPVPIGAMLSLTSRVTYTTSHQDSNDIAGVSVLAEVVDMETGERKKSNTFHFSFDIGESDKKISPETYKEAMEWIEGKRRTELGVQVRRIYASDD